MSFPTIPDINPEISITKVDALNLLLASIAFEELGLAHLVNAEAEKIQFALGTLHHDHRDPCFDLDDLLDLNNSVRGTLSTITQKEMLLLMKLQEVVQHLPQGPHYFDVEKPVAKRAESRPSRPRGRHKPDCNCTVCQLERSYRDL